MPLWRVRWSAPENSTDFSEADSGVHRTLHVGGQLRRKLTRNPGIAERSRAADCPGDSSELSPEDQVRLARIKPINPAAYQLYLKGRFFWEKRTEADLKKAIAYFRQAMSLDPAYGLAYAGIAHAYIPMLNKGFVSRQEGAQPLKLAALKAQELDDSLPETHTALAGAALDARDWAGVAATAESH